jgi:hypothetical protein
MFALGYTRTMKSKTVAKAERLTPDKGTVSDLITTLRGWYKGPGSLLRDRELDHKRDERIKDRKFAKMMAGDYRRASVILIASSRRSRISLSSRP